MIKNLPLEVLENICFYVKVEDLQNFLDAIGMEGSESFWRKICLRQGYNKITNKNSLWKNIFLQNINWITQRYVKRTYNFERNVAEARQADHSQKEDLLLGKHLVVNSCGEETLVWDISSSPNLVQTLPAKCISHRGNKLLTYSLTGVVIYLYNTHCFSKLYEVPVQISFNFHNFCSFTEDYFVILDINTCHMRVIDLKELTESSLMMPVTVSRFFSQKLSNDSLFILILEESNYKLKRFNLLGRTWLPDLVLFQCAVMIGVPKFEISSTLIVTWSNLLESPGITPVKIFALDGKFIASLPCTSCLESSETETLRPVEKILWMIVECGHLVFSTTKTAVSIWSPENLNYIKVIPKEDQHHYGQKVVSSSLLVLSYSYCFKVIDFKKSVYLYEVLVGKNQCSLNYFQSTKFFANEYYYIHFQYFENEDKIKTSTNEMLPLVSSFRFNYVTKGVSEKKCFLHIYDFTGTYSS